MFKYCISCGVPLNKKTDSCIDNDLECFCIHCIDSKCNKKDCKNDCSKGIKFFLKTDSNKNDTKKIICKKIKQLPYCKNKKCLKGKILTEKDIQKTLKKIRGE